jgi:hypothetical protein
MKFPTSISSSWKSLGYTVRTGLGILTVVYHSLIAPHRGRFALATFLNFCCRLLSLLAFISSIQALQIAFQFVVSEGEEFRGKEIFAYTGLPGDAVPYVVAAILCFIFALPSQVKKWETKLLSSIIRSIHKVLEGKGVLLPTDLFVITHIPSFLNHAVQFLSGMLFLVIALFIIMIFRFDLFILILGASFIIMGSIVLTGGRRINSEQAIVPLRSSYIEEARNAYREEMGEKKRRSATEVPILSSASRGLYFNAALTHWVKRNRASFNSSIIVGIAMGLVVLFVFRLDDLDTGQLVFLLFLIIAIRYAINTARDTGSTLTKLLETRAETAKLRHVIAAYKAQEDHVVRDVNSPQS